MRRPGRLRPPPRPLRRTLLSAGAAAALAAGLVAGGGLAVAPAAAGDDDDDDDRPASGPDTDRFPAPPVDWGPCDPDDYVTVVETGESVVPASYRCADYEVPLDYDRPRGETVTLSLIKRPADDPSRSRGTLVVDPGGPGGSARELVAYDGDVLFGPEVLAQYDIVGMDPRGISDSTPLQCYVDNAALIEDLDSDEFQGGWPASPAEWRAQRRDARDLARDCERTAGPIIDHMSTANVARDLDVLRRAVGDDQLTFAGYSYGTFICASYANLYPDRVGAMVCDGNIDPVEWTTGERRGEGRRVPLSARTGAGDGANDTLAEFFRLCDEAGPDGCALAPDAAARYDALQDRLAVEPVDLVLPEIGRVDAVPVDDQLLASLTLADMYDSTGWRVLAVVLAELERLAAGGAPSDVEAPPPAPSVIAPPVNEGYLNVEGFSGVICTDGIQPRGMGAWRRAVERAPEYLAPIWANSDNGCAFWPGRDRDRYLGPFDAETATTVLVVNPRFDPATPYDDAVAHRDLLPGSALLTLEGWGHTAVGLSSCADAVVDEYLLTGQVPAAETTCEQDVHPFAPLPGGQGPAAGDPAEGDPAEGEGLAATTEESVEEAADAALVTLATTGDPAEALAAAAEVTIEATEEAGDTETADRLRARQAIVGQIREATLG